MTEQYKLIDITSYTSKKGSNYLIAVVYFVYDGGFSDILRIIVSEEQADVLKQYLGQDISSLIEIKYNGYRKQFIPSIKEFE